MRNNNLEREDGLISSGKLCEILGINKTMLTKMRKGGLQPVKEEPTNTGRGAAFWNIEFVETWIADNKWDLSNVKFKSPDKIEEMYSRLCDAEKLSYNQYANLINNNASEPQISKARKEWTEVIKTLRSVERDIQKIHKKRLSDKKRNLSLNDRLNLLEDIILDNKDIKDRLSAIKLYSDLKGDSEKGEAAVETVLSFEEAKKEDIKVEKTTKTTKIEEKPLEKPIKTEEVQENNNDSSIDFSFIIDTQEEKDDRKR